MTKVGLITASYMWEGANYQSGVAWGELMDSFEKRWTPPRLDALLGRIAELRMPYVELWKIHVQNGSWDPAIARPDTRAGRGSRLYLENRGRIGCRVML